MCESICTSNTPTDMNRSKEQIAPHELRDRIARFADERPVRIGPTIHFVWQAFPMTCVIDEETQLLAVLCPVFDPKESSEDALAESTEACRPLSKNCGIRRRGNQLEAFCQSDLSRSEDRNSLETLVRQTLEIGLIASDGLGCCADGPTRRFDYVD